MNHVAPSRELDRVPACAAASIKNLRTRQGPAIDQPLSNHGALFTNRPVDQEVERPRVLGVEGTTRDLVHTDAEFVGLTIWGLACERRAEAPENQSGRAAPLVGCRPVLHRH
jgi:hypothetical protein